MPTVLAEAARRPLQPHAGREPAMNVWDNSAGSFREIRAGLASGAISLPDAVATGNVLLTSDDPARVKLGMHIHRLGMWSDPALAAQWINKSAPELAQHDHPRVRHSNIWNVRSAVWQDPDLGGRALSYAQAGLNDPDQGVQRASMWALGDMVSLDPNLFGRAHASLETFLQANPGESRDLFALERFFRPLRGPYGEDPSFVDSVRSMQDRSDGYPGLRARAAAMVSDEIHPTQIVSDREAVKAKLMQATSGTPDGEMLGRGNIGTVFDVSAHRFAQAETVGEGMGQLKLLRYLAWLSGDLQQPFEVVGRTLTDTRDGDLSRSASVFMTDCTLQQPSELAVPAAAAVTDFYKASAIDGSQIVISLILDPVRNGDAGARRVMASTFPTLHRLAANHSVNFALSNN